MPLTAEIPAAVKRDVDGDAAVARLSRETCSHIFAAADRLENEHRVLVQIRSRERLRDRARVAVAYVRPKLRPTERERALIPLPRFAGFLYWPLRLARLAAVYPFEIGKPLLSGLAGWR